MRLISRFLLAVSLLAIVPAAAPVTASASARASSAEPDPIDRDEWLTDAARALRLQNHFDDAAAPDSAADPTADPSLSASPNRSEAMIPSLDWPYSPWPIPTLSIDVHAIFLANDDGSRRVRCTPNQVEEWVAYANAVLSSAGIRLDFDPALGSGDWGELNSTLLNTMTGVEHPDWAAQKSLADAIASRTPSKMVVFFRWGPGATPTGGGFSWTDYRFIAAPGFWDTSVCGWQNIGLLAHEAGHYLGLPHTFARIFGSISAAGSFFSTWGNDPAVFEGDGRDDTPPDPYVSTWEVQCDRTRTSLVLNGVVLPLPRTNAMSYYAPIADVAPSQAWTIRQGLILRSGQSLGAMVDGSPLGPDEGESHAPTVTSGWWTTQGMGGFLGLWSGGRHLLWLDAAEGGELSFDFSVTRPGRYDVYASFTAAPDFGIHTHTINGQESGPVDLYSRIVLVTGPVYLGEYRLRAGRNQWKARAFGSNPRAVPRRRGYGLDYVLLVPRSVEYPARVFLRDTHRTVSDASASSAVCVRIEPMDQSFSTSEVDPTTIVVTNPSTEAGPAVAAIPAKSVFLGDTDRNGVDEMPACFPRESLASLLGSVSGRTVAELQVRGDLVTEGSFNGVLEVEVVGTGMPPEVSLAPNPLDRMSALQVATSSSGSLTVRIFDLRGRLVRTLASGAVVPPGRYTIPFDRRAEDGQALASGIYFYRVEAADGVARGRFVVTK